MTLTITKIKADDLGMGERVIADILFDSSYPAGGEAVTAKDLGFRVGSELRAVSAQRAVGDRVLEFIPDGSLADRGLLKVVNKALKNMVMSDAGLAIKGGSASPIAENAAAVVYLIAGEYKSKATADIAFTATSHDIAADGAAVQERVYAVSLDGAGTYTLTAGVIASGAGNGAKPQAPEGEALVGYIRVAVDAGATPFNATTDNLDASHLTVSFEDRAFADVEAEVEAATDLSAVTFRVVAEGR